MFAKLAVALAGVVLLLGVGAAQAFQFGNDETLHPIQDLTAKGPNGELLILAYKTTTLWLFGGVYVTDNGYVFRLKSDWKRYIPAKPELVAALQANGTLPNPLPPYRLSIVDYFIGYSLWTFVIPFVVIYLLIDGLRRRRRRRATASRAAASA
jgi:hypothetical protein